MKILRAEKFQPRKRSESKRAKSATSLRKTDWGVLVQHDRFTGKLNLRCAAALKDPGSVKRLLEAGMIDPNGKLTSEAKKKCAELTKKLMPPESVIAAVPELPKTENSGEPEDKQTVKLTASDWAVLVKYDRKTGNLLKYDPKTNELDNTSRAILKDPSIIQRLIDNNMILPGGWLTPEAKKECVRIEQKLKARAADDYTGPEGRLNPNGEPLSQDKHRSKNVPLPNGEQQSKAEPATEKPAEQDMQTFFEKISYEDPEPMSKGEQLPDGHRDPNPNPELQSKGERQSKEKPQSAPVVAQTKQHQKPIEDSASAETMNNIDWASISRSERKSEEKRRRRGRGPDSTDGDIPGPPAISMRDIFHVVFKRRMQIVLFFAAVFTTVVIGKSIN
jgi:hypothetical protein